MPDRLLLARARRGDQDAVAELYRHHIGAALGYARSITSNRADAEDLVAESFTQVLSQLALGKGPETSFRAYLFTTMRHRLYRANHREIPVDDEGVLDRAVCEHESDHRAESALLRQAFATLSAQEQEVLLLLDVQDVRPAQAGARLGLRGSALSMRAARARGALAEAYLAAHLQPSTDQRCEAIRPHLGRFVRGTLPAMRVRLVQDHLDECPACTNAVAELSEVNRGLRAIPVFALPEGTAHRWRSVLAHRSGTDSRLVHALGPSAVKSAVVASALAVGASAAIVLTSNASAAPTSAPTAPASTSTHVQRSAPPVVARPPTPHPAAATTTASRPPAQSVPARSHRSTPRTSVSSSQSATRTPAGSLATTRPPAPPRATTPVHQCTGWHAWRHGCGRH